MTAQDLLRGSGHAPLHFGGQPHCCSSCTCYSTTSLIQRPPERLLLDLLFKKLSVNTISTGTYHKCRNLTRALEMVASIGSRLISSTRWHSPACQLPGLRSGPNYN
jgi:hypothetical protein